MRYPTSPDSPPSSSVTNNSIITTALHEPPQPSSSSSSSSSSTNPTRRRHFSAASLLQHSRPPSHPSPPPPQPPPQSHRRFHSSRSPSLKAALSDPSLSATLKSAVPERWDRDRDREESKGRFEKNVRRYFFQLTVGCGLETCANRLCRSSSASPKLTADAAAIMSVQLASRPRLFLCKNCPENPVIALPKSTLIFGSDEGAQVVPSNQSSGSSSPANKSATGENRPQTPVKPFLYSLFASPSFANIFSEAEVTNDGDNGNRLRSEAMTASKTRIRNVHNDGTASASCSPRTSPRRLSSDTGVRTVLSGLSNVIFGRPKTTEKPPSSHLPHQESEHVTADSSRGGFATPTTPWRSKSLFDLPTLFSSSTSIALRDKQQPEKTSTTPAETESSLEGYMSSEEQVQCTDITGDCYRDAVGSKSRSSIDPTSARHGEAHATCSRKPWGRHQRWHTENTDPAHFTNYTSSTSAALPPNDDTSAWSSGSDGEDLELSLTYLTLPLLQQAIATYKRRTRTRFSANLQSPEDPSDGAKESDRSSDSEREDPSFLINTIRTVFSSSDALGRSFLQDSTTDVPVASSGLDLPSLRTSYDLILNLEPKHLFTTALTNAMEILVARLEMNNRTLAQRPEGLRQLLILLENPMLRDEFHHEVLTKKITRIIAGLNKKAKSILVLWFSEYDAHAFTAIVNIFQNYLVDHYTPNPRGEDAAVLTVKVLSLLCSANEVKADGIKHGPIIPIDVFYNEPLCHKLNFKDEHRQWKKSREIGSKNITQFSYFNYPFLFDPVAKSRIMHIDAMMQMSQEYENACVHQAMIVHTQRLLLDSTQRSAATVVETGSPSPYLVFSVRRELLVQDALNLVNMKENDLKKPMKVKFVGGGEDGMDQGGVQKEFFQVLVAQLLDPSYGMFTYDEETRYSWINGNSLEPDRKFEQVGIILGLALYNGIIIGASFPRLFYKKILGEHIGLEDVKDAFPSLGKGLAQMLTWTDGDVSDVFMRSFEISYEVYGQVKTIPLVDGGEIIPVTNKNRKEYVRLYIDHLTHNAVDRQFRALKRGFHKVCGGNALQMCLPEELELLLCGSGNLDFEELEKGAMYDDGYSKDHPLIRHFWSIVHGLTLDQKKMLLLFVTASDRVPIKGLAKVTFVIQRNGPDSERLPTALTCFGRLLLPEYSTRKKLSERLLTAIENSTGFGLL